MRITMLVVAVAFVAVGCVPSPADVCKSGINTSCTKMHECTDAATKASTVWQGIFGTSVDDCKTKLEASANCTARTSYDQGCTGTSAGKKYDLGKASECSNAIKAQSCTDFMDATKSPAACAQVCQ